MYKHSNQAPMTPNPINGAIDNVLPWTFTFAKFPSTSNFGVVYIGYIFSNHVHMDILGFLGNIFWCRSTGTSAEFGWIWCLRDLIRKFMKVELDYIN